MFSFQERRLVRAALEHFHRHLEKFADYENFQRDQAQIILKVQGKTGE